MQRSKLLRYRVPVEKIRYVIGTGGKAIRETVYTTRARVAVEDDGTIKVASSDQKSSDPAGEWMHGLTADPEVGAI